MSLNFRKVYLEISNICNLQCTFCPVVERDQKVMALSEIEKILQQIKPYAERVCFHVMGEPLNHPQWAHAIVLAEKQNISLEITTNGTLLKPENFANLLNPAVKQINFSLQSFVDNFPKADPQVYFQKIIDFVLLAEQQRPDLYINFRFWNLAKEKVKITPENPVNEFFLQTIEKTFQTVINRQVDPGFRKSKNVRSRIYVHFDTRFEWPNVQAPFVSEEGTCWGARAQVAIHASGVVVPCCLDKEADVPLGNINTQSFEEILSSPRFLKMRQGFEENRVVESLCQRCSFRTRFKRAMPLTEEEFQ